MKIIELLKVILLGIVEGITEWLPISSTGHMILINEFIKLNVSEAFMELFLVVIQLGAILAVIVLYFNKLNPFSLKKSKEEKKDTWDLLFKILVACVPAGIIGILFDDKIDALFYNYQTVAITLILYGILFIIFENRNKNKKVKFDTTKQLTYKMALIIGVAQILALIPGTSRSGATILAGLLVGASRETSAEFTFFLAIPVMLGASLLKLVKFGLAFTQGEIIILLIGMLVAFTVSIIAIKFLMRYIKKNDFKPFGWYRIILGIVVLLYFLILG